MEHDRTTEQRIRAGTPAKCDSRRSREFALAARTTIAACLSIAAIAMVLVNAFCASDAHRLIREHLREQQAWHAASLNAMRLRVAADHCRHADELLRAASLAPVVHSELLRMSLDATDDLRVAIADAIDREPGLSLYAARWVQLADRFDATAAAVAVVPPCIPVPRAILRAGNFESEFRDVFDVASAVMGDAASQVLPQLDTALTLSDRLANRQAILSAIMLALVTLCALAWNWRMGQTMSELARSKSHVEAALRERDVLWRTMDKYGILSVTDSSGTIIAANEQFCRISGYAPDELIGQNHRKINSGCHPKSFWVEMWRTVSSGREWRGEVCNRAKDGSLYWVDSTIAPYRNAAGKITKYVSMRTDITSRKKAEESQRLQSAHARLEAEVGASLTNSMTLAQLLKHGVDTIAEHLDVAIARAWVLEPDADMLELQASAGQFTEHGSKQCRVRVGSGEVGRVAAEKRVIVVNDMRDDSAFAESAGSDSLVAFTGFPLIAEGHVLGVLEMYSRVPLPPYIHCVLTNLSQTLANGIRRHFAELALRIAARTDRLTGLPNRGLFLERIQHAWQRARLDPEERFAVLFLDFDRFKIINDCLGHEAGDELLRQIAGRLRSFLPPFDSLEGDARGHLAARLGGDEFVILLDRLQHRDYAAIVADELLDVLSHPYRLGDRDVHSTASIGIVTSDMPSDSAEEVLRNADIAMYEAKVAGRARYALFDASMYQRVRQRHVLENDLRIAVGAKQIDVEYQPIVDPVTGRIRSFEALARWTHPELGPISPADFIPIAEETGLIVPLGRYVLEQACGLLERLRATPGGDSICMNVNVSPRQLADENYIEELAEFLDLRPFPPDCVRFEITESAIMAGRGSIEETLGRMRSLGVKLHLDDFGTGLSSLSLLRTLPLDGIKIDRSFIEAANGDRESIAILHAIVILGKNLGKSITAEGIEEDSQVAMAVGLDCDLVQGYLFGRATTAETAEALVRETPLLTRTSASIRPTPVGAA